jgi:hypothetical protein
MDKDLKRSLAITAVVVPLGFIFPHVLAILGPIALGICAAGGLLYLALVVRARRRKKLTSPPAALWGVHQTLLRRRSSRNSDTQGPAARKGLVQWYRNLPASPSPWKDPR